MEICRMVVFCDVLCEVYLVLRDVDYQIEWKMI